MNDRVHPNPGSVFPCPVYAGNVTRRHRSVQCCTCSKWIHLKCSLLFFSRFRTLDSSHSWSFPLLRPCFFWRSHTYKHGVFLLELLQLVDLHCSIWPFCYRCTPAPPSPSNLLFPFRILCIFSLCTLTTASCFWLFLYTTCFLLSLTLSRFFSGMLGVSEPETLSFYTLFLSRSLSLIYLPFSGSLDSLLCVLIAPTPGLVFSLLMPRTPAAALSYSSGRAYPSLKFLPSLFLRLTPTLIVWESTSL